MDLCKAVNRSSRIQLLSKKQQTVICSPEMCPGGPHGATGMAAHSRGNPAIDRTSSPGFGHATGGLRETLAPVIRRRRCTPDNAQPHSNPGPDITGAEASHGPHDHGFVALETLQATLRAIIDR